MSKSKVRIDAANQKSEVECDTCGERISAEHDAVCGPIEYEQ